MRVADGAYRTHDLGHGVGHYHRLRDDPAGHAYRPAPVSTSPRPRLDYAAIFARWAQYTPPEAIDALAATLGVCGQALRRLDVAYCPERRAWAFPMHDDRRQVVGVRLRREDGHKFALDGSASGLMIPRGLDSKSPLLLVEGPTDTAAALTLGYQAIGRPSNTGGAHLLCDLLEVGRRRDVIIVSDNDGLKRVGNQLIDPGRYGARRLAGRILGLCRSVRIISPAPHKDLRDWLRAGATAIAVKMRIDNASFFLPSEGANGNGLDKGEA